MAEPHPIPTDPRFQDLNGRVFGQLTVLFYAGRKSNKYSLWHCRCECGKERTLVSSQLTFGRTSSCVPCFRTRPKQKTRSDLIDLTGQVFGRLTVASLDHISKKPPRTYWLCNCSCGQLTVARADFLKDGKRTSCGCAHIAQRWLDKPIPETAECRICHKVLPLNIDNFYRHPASKHGFNLICCPCFRTQRNVANKRYAGKLRMEALTAYSGTPPKCQCPNCPETLLEFLSIDHIDGGGYKHRQTVSNIYRWLRINKYPPGFRVLCMNCNFSRGKYGYCPHCR